MIPFQMMQDAINFTFHNVSINTWQRLLLQFWNPSLHSTMFLLILWQLPRANISDITLHSTMFLLIRGSTTGIVTSVSSFTFHNVSINTSVTCIVTDWPKSLHSTMFLLIPGANLNQLRDSNVFTFHNVSINTGFSRAWTVPLSSTFTFHNVSINTSPH